MYDDSDSVGKRAKKEADEKAKKDDKMLNLGPEVLTMLNLLHLHSFCFKYFQT